METDPLRYDKWIEEALRQVILRAMLFIQEKGLPGQHHFYITFLTAAAGVQLPPYLRAQHPEDMTIVLQNQFWDLEVTEKEFSVSLRFKGKMERLRIPFDAVTAFADPSVNFGLQLKMVQDTDAPPDGGGGGNGGQDGSQNGSQNGGKKGEVIALDLFRKK